MNEVGSATGAMKSSKSFYNCARCDKRISLWVYSHHTSKRYCRDYDACAKRAKKKEKDAKAV